MKAIFSVYFMSVIPGRRVYHCSYATKSAAMKKARSMSDLGGTWVVVKHLPFGEDLAVFEV